MTGGKVDKNNDNVINLDEFVIFCYYLIICHDLSGSDRHSMVDNNFGTNVAVDVFSGDDGDEDEVEEVPEEFSELSPEEQQKAIMSRAFKMLAIGTLMVVYFSDPMVDVMQEIAVKANIPPFYVSFVLAPLASNSSEVVASMFYAAKKTRKTITVALTALEGAASMNNTFCLSIFMGLIYFRGLAWQYSAETISIILVQFGMGVWALRDRMSTMTALIVLALFPLSV